MRFILFGRLQVTNRVTQGRIDYLMRCTNRKSRYLNVRGPWQPATHRWYPAALIFRDSQQELLVALSGAHDADC